MIAGEDVVIIIGTLSDPVLPLCHLDCLAEEPP